MINVIIISEAHQVLLPSSREGKKVGGGNTDSRINQQRLDRGSLKRKGQAIKVNKI